MWILRISLSLVLLAELNGLNEKHSRQKRYLVFPPATQWGVFATISVPLHPENTVSVAYFYEANYFTVDNTTYYDPLLGDIAANRNLQRSSRSSENISSQFSRANIYTVIEDLLHRHGYGGRSCMLRAICESATAKFPHGGLLGDLLHIILTPSTSMSEENIEDLYYKAEYLGLEDQCGVYEKRCPSSPLNLFSLLIENIS